MTKERVMAKGQIQFQAQIMHIAVLASQVHWLTLAEGAWVVPPLSTTRIGYG